MEVHPFILLFRETGLCFFLNSNSKTPCLCFRARLSLKRKELSQVDSLQKAFYGHSLIYRRHFPPDEWQQGLEPCFLSSSALNLSLFLFFWDITNPPGQTRKKAENKDKDFRVGGKTHSPFWVESCSSRKSTYWWIPGSTSFRKGR